MQRMGSVGKDRSLGEARHPRRTGARPKTLGHGEAKVCLCSISWRLCSLAKFKRKTYFSLAPILDTPTATMSQSRFTTMCYNYGLHHIRRLVGVDHMQTLAN
jgi:hypothetical protein